MHFGLDSTDCLDRFEQPMGFAEAIPLPLKNKQFDVACVQKNERRLSSQNTAQRTKRRKKVFLTLSY